MPVLIFIFSVFIAFPAFACTPPAMTGAGHVQDKDQDRNGTVEFEDFRIYYTNRDGSFDEEQMRAYFAEFDYDRDGHITAEEYDRNELEYQQRCTRQMMGVEAVHQIEYEEVTYE